MLETHSLNMHLGYSRKEEENHLQNVRLPMITAIDAQELL